MGLSYARLAALLLLPASAVLALDGETQKLKPMVPPNLDSHNRQLLQPASDLTLYFTTSEEDLQKRDTPEVFAKVGFQFNLPAIALDHTDYIEVLGCSDDSIKGKFNDKKAFADAMTAWSDSKLLLVTSTAGCGTPDNDNGYLQASAVEFFKDEMSFKATGVFAEPGDTFNNLDVEWGATEASAGATGDESSLKKRVDFSKTREFEVSPQVAAGLLKGKSYAQALKDARSEDAPNAPWPRSFPLWSTKKSSKREVELAERANGDLDAALNIYCVDCGINGRITLGGRFEFNIWQLQVKKLEAYFNGQLHAGLFLGFEAYLNYEKQWKTTFANANLAGWEIAGIVSVGPYISLDLEASFAVHAKGLLIVGGAVDWPDFGANLNVLEPSKSTAWGFTPQLSKTFNASAELDIGASLGLPVSIGLQILLGKASKPLWTANVRFQDTPSINAKATAKLEYNAKRSIDAAAEYSEDGVRVFDYSTDPVNDTSATEHGSLFETRDATCYGIDWEIYVGNTMKLVAEAKYIGNKEYTLRNDRWTLGKGCIGAQEPKCKGAVVPAAVAPSSIKCNQRVGSYNDKYNAGSLLTGKDRRGCAKSCMTRDSCKAFAWKQGSQSCWLLSAPFASIGGAASSASDAWDIFDRNCFQTKDCMLATDTKPSPIQ